MKIIFVTWEGYDFAGPRLRCYGFSEEFKKRNIDSNVFSFIDNLGSREKYLESNLTLREKFNLLLRNMPYLLKEEKCIFVVSRINYHIFPSWLSSFLRKTSYVFDMDDWEFREDIGYYFKIFPKSKAEYLTRIFSCHSKFCIAASHYLKEYLSQFNKKVYFIPTGVDTTRFKPKNFYKNENVVFSWHGLISRKEVVNYLKFIIECFLIVNKEIKNTQLWIKGTGTFIKDFLNIFKKYKNENIKYFAWSHPDDIPFYLDKVDIGLFPLLDKTHFNLSKCPVKVLEYMAKKIPVIASRIGEVRYIITSNYDGFLADLRDARDAFIYYMLKLAKESSLREIMGENAHQKVREYYSLNKLGEKLYNIFKENFGEKIYF